MAKEKTPSLAFLNAPTVHKARKPRKRRMRRDGTSQASKAIGDIEPGCEIFGFTRGQFSLTDIILHILKTTGPADIVVSTWTAAHADIQTHHRLLADGRVRSMRFLVDRSFPTRQPEYSELLVAKFGAECIRLTRTHAKFVLIRNENWNLAIRTSMNLNTNPRFENFEISDDPALADFLQAIVDEAWERTECGVEVSTPAVDSVFGRSLKPNRRAKRPDAEIFRRR